MSITRQLMITDDEDEEPQQLSLTFHFDPTVAPQGLEESSQWCEGLEDLEELRAIVTGSEA